MNRQRGSGKAYAGLGRQASLVIAGLVLALLIAPGMAQARKGDVRTGLFVGSTRYFLEGDTTVGTTFGLMLSYEVVESLELRLAGSYAATEGTHTLDGVDYPLSARTTTARLGTTYFFNRAPSALVVFFAGGGVSMLNYTIDHTYPNSPVNQISGTAPGGYLHMGAELKLTKAVTLIPVYEYQGHVLNTDAGGSAIYSTGFLLTLRISG